MADQRLKLIIYGDATPAQKALNSLNRDLKNLTSKLDSAGRSLTMGVTAPVLAVGAAVTKLAVDAQESENLFRVSMGKMEGSARSWSEEMSDALGLNSYEVRKNVGVFNTMLTSMLGNEQAAYDMSKGIVELGYDLESFYNLRAQGKDAFEILRAGITGEAEPLKALGVLIDENTIKTYAYTHGIAKQGAELTQQQKVQARYGAILEQTADAQGDLARTQDSAANRMKALQNTATDLGIKFGEMLLPVLEDAVEVGQGMVDWLDSLSTRERKVVLALAGIAAATGPVLIGAANIINAFRQIIVWSGSKRVAILRDAAAEKAALDGVAASANGATGAGAAGAAGGKMAGLWTGLSTMAGPAMLAMGAKPAYERQAAGMDAATSKMAPNVGRSLGIVEGGFKRVHKEAWEATEAGKEYATSTDGITAANNDAAAATDNLVRAMNGQMVAEDSLAGKTRTALEAKLDMQEANIAVKAAEENLNRAIKENGKNSDEAKQAAIDLQRAQLRAKDATVDFKKAAKDESVLKAFENWKKKWDGIATAAQRARDAANQAGYATKQAAQASAARSAGMNAGGGGGRPLGSAMGRIVTKPLLSWVGEAGYPESIISWDPRYRQRSLGIMAQTASALGVGGGNTYNVYVTGDKSAAQHNAVQVQSALYNLLDR